MNGNGHRNWKNLTSFAVLILAFLFMCGILLYLVWPYQTATVSNVSMVTPVVKVGEEVIFEFTFEKKTKLPADYSIGLVNHQVYDLASGVVDSPEGTYTSQKSVIISKEVPPGEYRIAVTMKYEVNPIRTITVEFETADTFEVVE